MPPTVVLDLSDSEDEDWTSSQFEIPPSSQTDYLDLTDDLSDDDDDLPTTHDLMRSDKYATPSQRSTTLSIDGDSDFEVVSSPSKRSRSEHSSPSDSEDASPVPKKKSRARKTEAEKEAEKAKKKADAEEKKVAKAALKEAKKAEQARLAEEKKVDKAANKLQKNKKETVKDIELVLSASFQEYEPSLYRPLRQRLDKHEAATSYSNETPFPGYATIRWRRTTSKTYHPAEHRWIVHEPFVTDERTALLWLTADNLLMEIRSKALTALVKRFRAAHGFESKKDQVFIMIYGLRKLKPQKREEAARALASLQFAMHTHHIFVESTEEAVSRLYDLSADLSIKPYKFIERAHLPFCADTKVRCGKSPDAIWKKMLHEMKGVTENVAGGIVNQYPTAQSLLSMYERLDQRQGERLLIGLERSDNQRVGDTTSRRVHTVMWGENPLELVVKG